MKPGATTLPAASITRFASPARPPTATTRPPTIDTSPRRPGNPEPSTIKPLEMTRSSTVCLLHVKLSFERREHHAPRLPDEFVDRADPGRVERGSTRFLVERDRRCATAVVGELHLDLGAAVVSADDGRTCDDGVHARGGGSVNTMSLGSSPPGRPIAARIARC